MLSKYNPLAAIMYQTGYVNDGAVPVTSAFLDYSKHDDFIAQGDTNDILFEAVHPTARDPFNRIYKSSLFLKELTNSGLNIF